MVDRNHNSYYHNIYNYIYQKNRMHHKYYHPTGIYTIFWEVREITGPSAVDVNNVCIMTH
jgi:hypothetical protein